MAEWWNVVVWVRAGYLSSGWEKEHETVKRGDNELNIRNSDTNAGSRSPLKENRGHYVAYRPMGL